MTTELDTKQNEALKMIDLTENIPTTDVEAWRAYPKYHWVYSTSRLLDLQNIKWQPFFDTEFCASVSEFHFHEESGSQVVWNKPTAFTDENGKEYPSKLWEAKDGARKGWISEGCIIPGEIFVKPIEGDALTTDVVLLKGEVKWLAHHRVGEEVPNTFPTQYQRMVLEEINGNLELRISAMAKMALPKFTGVISVVSIGTTILGVRLRMTQEAVSQYPDNWMQNVVKLYNRKQWPK